MKRPNTALVCHAVVIACFGWRVGLAPAQVVDPDFPITDGKVNSLARSGSTLYLGGEFTRIGPCSGAGVPFDAGTGVPLPGFPKVAGWINTVVADGAGGWFIGGYFTRVGDQARTSLAHLLSDLTVSSWSPTLFPPASEVASLAVSGARIGGASWRGATRARSW